MEPRLQSILMNILIAVLEDVSQVLVVQVFWDKRGINIRKVSSGKVGIK